MRMQNISGADNGVRGEPRFNDANNGNDIPSSRFYLFAKQVFDRLVALAVLPVVAGVGLFLLILNPFFNRGPLLFIQTRAGMHSKPFPMVKFRSMVPSDVEARDPNADLEQDRITPLGRYLRHSRIDELPNFWNVLMGDMSIVGPRPDAVNHAEYFSKTIPGYDVRSEVRPGITGLAQVSMGYAEGEEDTVKKTLFDQAYIRKVSLKTDVYIMFRTLVVMATGFGSK